MHHRDVDLSAFSDPLTGLPSARVWAEGVNWAVEHARGTGGSLTAALLDVDRFEVLASHDERACDRLLRTVAAAWHDHLDDAGLVARLFGGRFGLLLPVGLEAALETIDALRALTPGDFTCSAGIAVWEGEDAERLASRADGALVGAKLHGRDRAVVAC